MKTFIPLLFLLCSTLATAQTVPDPKNLITHNGKPLFLSGMNLAWINFAKDLEQFDEVKFTQKVNDIAYNGGNTIRWWLFVNGTSSPSFGPDGKVSGLEESHLRALKRALDIAAERGVGLLLCLWSFDMLQDTVPADQLKRNTDLLTKKDFTQAWIDNALVPMVKAVGNHPGLMAWEVFNEPEGMAQSFGWTRKKVTMEKIQAFVNRTAGAIHRAVPGALVTNGSWNVQVVTDEHNLYSYYTDEGLIQAGGDPDGVLDFYQIHYYQEHFSDDTNPFHHPKAYWGLDKPVLIGEFASKGIVPIAGKGGFKASKQLTTEQAYRWALEQGYAGALSWTMSNHDGFGGFGSSQDAVQALADDYPELIAIDTAKVVRSPSLAKPLAEPLLALGVRDWGTILDLREFFRDFQEGSELTYSLVTKGEPSVADLSLSPQGLLTGKPGPSPAAANIPVTVRAVNRGGASIETSFLIHVLDPDHGNVALFKPIAASSSESAESVPAAAVDGNGKTRWSSAYLDDQTLTIDLQGRFRLNKAVVTWEAAYGRTYDVEGSEDGKEWKVLGSVVNGDGGTDEISLSGAWNHVRLNLKQRGTQWGFSPWEVEIVGDRETP